MKTIHNRGMDTLQRPSNGAPRIGPWNMGNPFKDIGDSTARIKQIQG